MIGQMLTLRRVKELRQEQAFRAMRIKREEFDTAVQATQKAKDIVDESAATLPSREDAIYAEVLGSVIDLDQIEETRGKVVALEKEHTLLKDDLERASHVQARVEGELNTATDHYKQSTKAHDKYVIITDNLKQEIEEAANYKEETEIEDLFSRPRKMIHVED